MFGVSCVGFLLMVGVLLALPGLYLVPKKLDGAMRMGGSAFIRSGAVRFP